MCPFHRWITEAQLVDILIKKTGEIVKKCLHCEKYKLENKKIRQEDWKKEKENLTDYYIRRTFVAGQKYSIPMHEYPDSLVEAKRASLLLKRKTKKLMEPIKKCIHHGKLYIKDIIKSGISKSGAQQYKCKHCMQEMHKKHYELNKLKIRLTHQKYRAENKEKVKETKRKSRLKNIEKEQERSRERWQKYMLENPSLARERNRKYKRKMVRELTDTYIKKSLTDGTMLRYQDVPESLINAKRAVFMLRRGIKKQATQTKLNIQEKEKHGKD